MTNDGTSVSNTAAITNSLSFEFSTGGFAPDAPGLAGMWLPEA
jgi:hypothetical protein